MKLNYHLLGVKEVETKQYFGFVNLTKFYRVCYAFMIFMIKIFHDVYLCSNLPVEPRSGS